MTTGCVVEPKFLCPRQCGAKDTEVSSRERFIAKAKPGEKGPMFKDPNTPVNFRGEFFKGKVRESPGY